MQTRNEVCATCRFFCQEIDPESRLYFDAKSGECRLGPPRDHFVWQRTKLFHWCGQWRPKDVDARGWQRINACSDGDEALLLFRKHSFCQGAGMIIGYWNRGFKKWHDGADQLLEREQVSHWMALPDPPAE
jgi:hypothetical protein